MAFFKAFINKFIFNEEIRFPALLPCSHFKIGSSLVEKLMKKTIQLEDTHSCFKTGTNRFRGNKVEDYYEEAMLCDSKYLRHVFRISDFMPFICSSLDFLVEKNKSLMVYEIKSSKSMASARSAQNNSRYLTQLNVTMDVFQVKYGRIISAHDETNYEKSNFKKGTAITFTGDSTIIENNEFLWRNKKKIIDGYVYFLGLYFEKNYKQKITPPEKKEITEFLLSKVKRNKKPFKTKLSQVFASESNKIECPCTTDHRARMKSKS